jgi:hypothetical protein
MKNKPGRSMKNMLAGNNRDEINYYSRLSNNLFGAFHGDLLLESRDYHVAFMSRGAAES